MTDTLEIFGVEYTGVTGIKATDDNDQVKTYIRPEGTKSISANGTGIDVTNYAAVDVAVPQPEDGDLMEYGSVLTDLTGTSWSFNVTDANFSTLADNLPNGGDDFMLSYSWSVTKLNSQTYTGTVNNSVALTLESGYICLYMIEENAMVYDSYSHSPALQATAASISITGGTDATNSELISILYLLATRTA